MNRLFYSFCFFLLMCLTLPISAQTVLQAGDLAVLGLASNVGGDQGGCTPAGNGQFEGRDRVSFVCFQDIAPGTLIDITDNGWERETTGFWGNTEGFIRATRTGDLIPAGTVITFEFPPTDVDAQSVSPDGDWTFSALGTNALNFNDGGDQLYFLQGGDWNNGTVLGCCNGEQDASYTGGKILFAFNSKSTWIGLLGDSQNSALHPDIIPCFNMTPTSGVTSFSSYSGPLSEASHLEWIGRISNPDNWEAYDNCNAYQDPVANLAIAPSAMSIECTVCQSCSTFQDTLIFNLPDSGGPFGITYSNGQDTFSLEEITNGTELPITVDASISYTLVSVTDANSCPVYSNLGPDTDLSIQSTAPSLSCEPSGTAPNGSVVLTISGGTAPYVITWSNINGLSGSISEDGSTPVTLNELSSAGIYEVKLMDSAGCTDSCNFDIEGPDCGLEVVLEGVDPICKDPKSGTITALITGQQGAIYYQWDQSGLNGNENSNLAAGEYGLTVSDDAGCLDSARFVLQEPDQLDVALELTASFACGSGWGIQIVNIIGGVAPYTVRVNEAGSVLPIDELPQPLSDLLPGNYNLIFEDQDGCQTVSNIVVPDGSNERNLILDLGPDRRVQRGQSVRIAPNINFNPILVEWSSETGVQDPNDVFTLIRPDRTTLYTATATDLNGCTIRDSILLTVFNEERVFIPSAFSPNNDGVNDRFMLFPGPEVSEIRSFRVFDRWGNKVYDAVGNFPPEEGGWDGRLLNGQKAASGIYLYFTELQDQHGEVEIVRGSLTLIR